LDAARYLIIVELPGISNPERARKFLQATAKLEFWDVYQVNDAAVVNGFFRADEKLKQLQSGDTTTLEEEKTIVYDSSYVYQYDSLGNVQDSTLEVTERTEEENPFDNAGPLLSLLQLNGSNPTAPQLAPSSFGLADMNKTANISKMLDRPEIRALFPKDVKFMWGRKPWKNYTTGEYTKQYVLYGIKMQKGTDKAPLEGDRVTDASPTTDPQTGQVQVALRMDPKGAKRWAEMTTKAARDNNRSIAIVLDDKVESAQSVNDPLISGSSVITGGYSLHEADGVAKNL